MTTVSVGDEEITGWQLHELHSERSGAKAEGKASHDPRTGQPKDYAQAQAKGRLLEESGIDETAFNTHMKKGDAVELQAAIIEGRAKKNMLTPEEVEAGLRERGDTYRQAIQLAMAA